MIENIVFFYMYVAMCIVLFDILFVVNGKYQKKYLPKKKAYIKGYIENYDHEGVHKKFIEKFKNIGYLTALQEILIEEQENPIFQKKLDATLPDFVQIAVLYKKKQDAEQAYFAYVMRLMGPKVYNGAIRDIVSILITWIEESTLYVKENVFKVIMTFGTCHDVLEALRIMNDTVEKQNERLISGNLLEFGKSQQELANLLHHELGSFSVTIQLAIINYLNYLPLGQIDETPYFESLYKKLINPKEDKEIRLAIMRYFKKYYYEPVSKILMELATAKEEWMWEYVAIAIKSLQSYPTVEAVKVLKESICSPNWYIRWNAAEVLIALEIDEEEVWKNQYDAYGKAMMQYRRGIREIKER